MRKKLTEKDWTDWMHMGVNDGGEYDGMFDVCDGKRRKKKPRRSSYN